MSMDSLERIIEILAWPLTAMIVVMLMRKPLAELVSTLKRLKYRDLELEFEKEANKILAEAERDLPEPPKEKPDKESSGILFSRVRLEPSTEIMESWRNLELKLRSMLPEGSEKLTTRVLVSELEGSGKICKSTSKLILDLASLRNRVTHTTDEAVSYEVSTAFSGSVKRVISALELKNA